MHAYLDYNITPDLQLHTAFESESRERTTLLFISGLTTTRTAFVGSLRYFPSPSTGWFIGGGSGFASIKQEYHLDDVANSSATLVPFFVDVGWQGWDGYYFTVNAWLGGTSMTSKSDNTGKISDDSNHRSAAKEDFAAARGFNAILVGFGWYLK